MEGPSLNAIGRPRVLTSQLHLRALRAGAELARVLNMKKILSPGGLRWTMDRVKNFRREFRIHSGVRGSEHQLLTQNEAASYLGVSRNALKTMVKIGALTTNQVTDFAPWKITRIQLDSERVRHLVKALQNSGRLPQGGCPNGPALPFPP